MKIVLTFEGSTQSDVTVAEVGHRRWPGGSENRVNTIGRV